MRWSGPGNLERPARSPQVHQDRQADRGHSWARTHARARQGPSPKAITLKGEASLAVWLSG